MTDGRRVLIVPAAGRGSRLEPRPVCSPGYRNGVGLTEGIRTRVARRRGRWTYAASEPDAIAPDGSEVRLLSRTDRGSMAHFALAPHAVSRAVAHKTVEEVATAIICFAALGRRATAVEGA